MIRFDSERFAADSLESLELRRDYQGHGWSKSELERLYQVRRSDLSGGALYGRMRLLEIIAAEKKASKPQKGKSKVAPSSSPSNVVNIMDALRKSVATEKRVTK
ncbi:MULTISPECIES: hypothetical protein [Sinorhizobium]|uniref:hypothetical protein n=1 Tax=Sinorhizobium sp. NG07B TaxID=1538174 RepID=UPI001F3C3A1F|nr:MULTISPECIES: hypothetical protein [Sinorhizobium]